MFISFEKNGGDNGTRTHDNGFADRGLNQLGYVTVTVKYNINPLIIII